MLHVFVVDDQKTNRNVVAKLAASLRPSVRVHEFDCPKQALKAVSATIPDLVVTDYKMPGMNGAEFIRSLRQLLGCGEVPAIVVTAYGDREFRYDALDAGATDFLLSPVDHAEFKARAGNLLILRRQQRIIRRRASLLEARLRNRTRVQERALRYSEETFRLIVNTVPAMVTAVDSDGVCVYSNNQQGMFFGVDPDVVAGQPMEHIFDAEYAERHRALNSTIQATGAGIRDVEETLLDTCGTERVFLTTKAPLFSSDNEVTSIVTVSVDITQRKELESSLWSQAHFDVLTSLPNRKLLHDRLTQALTRGKRNGRAVGVFYIDLDGFKHINDAYGHGVGDQVLKAAANRLDQRMRASDTLARLGGDELVAVVEGLDSPDAADDFANKLLAGLHNPISTEGVSFQVRASIGIALSGADSTAPESILAHADAALYVAKTQGGNRWAYYTPELTARAQRRIHLEGALRRALEYDNSQLALAVQPIRDIASWAIVGYEALVRWCHPEEGWMQPKEFLPTAESTGLMNWLGSLVLESAARWAVTTLGKGWTGRVAVNVSPGELASRDFVEKCTAILHSAGLEPRQLELEITEDGLMSHDAEMIRRLEALRAAGVRIAIDDFGTGYSSLQYIKALPADRLKIDRSFIAGVADDPDNQAIVAAAVTVAGHFGLDIVAEGVERVEDARTLERLGLRQIQGYYSGRPYLVGRFGTF